MKPYPTTEPDTQNGMVPGLEPRTALEPNRGDLILLLGALSLFLCGPLGIVAWIMGNSDLRNVAAGRMSGYRIGMVKTGRVLGIIGTALTPLLATLLVVFMAGLGPHLGPERSGPLKPDQIVFSGEWLSEKGTIIAINADGTGDFKTGHASVTGGRVKIEQDRLSIGLMGIYKTWHIKRKPFLKDGVWQMDLDGEIFIRKTAGHLVLITRADVHAAG